MNWDGVLSELYELIYTSMTPDPLTEKAVSELLTRARDRNEAHNITGLLYYDGQRFLQIIEGSKPDIETLYELIQNDDRHQDIELLHSHAINIRSFQNWSMAYESLPNAAGDAIEDRLELISFEVLAKRKPSATVSLGARLFDLFVKSERVVKGPHFQSNI